MNISGTMRMLSSKMALSTSFKWKKSKEGVSPLAVVEAPPGPARSPDGLTKEAPVGMRSESSDSLPRLVLDIPFAHARADSPEPAQRRSNLHVEAFEQSLGLTTEELKAAMTLDAARQEPVVALMATILDGTVSRNDIMNRTSGLPEFERQLVKMKASAYVERILRYSHCSPCCIIVGLMYLQRLKARHNDLRITSHNMQRLLLTAVLIAHKYFDDEYFSNDHWAEIGGITTKELNRLELKFLFHLRFTCNVQREEYDEYLRNLGSGAYEGMLTPHTK